MRIWNTVSSAAMIVLKLEVGVPSGKLNWPPKSCMPSSAKMKMNRKSRKSRDMMDDKAFIRAITRLRRGDQYLGEKGSLDQGFSAFMAVISLGHFENSEQSERPEAAESERAGPGLQVDPEDLEERSRDDGAVESVEGRLEVHHGAERVKADQHLEHERAQEQELGVDWKKRRSKNTTG